MYFAVTDQITSRTEVVHAITPAHIADAKSLLQEYANALNFDLCFQSFDAELANLPGDYAPPSGRLFIAYVDSEPAASIALHAWSDPQHPTLPTHNICEMKRLYVCPQFRGHHLAHQLIDRLITEARNIGYTHMRLDTVVGTMDAAINLYRQYGFYEISPYRPNPQPRVLYFELKL
jgi:ribosomal protein S18 acetylase RimI-like enzyme